MKPSDTVAQVLEKAGLKEKWKGDFGKTVTLESKQALKTLRELSSQAHFDCLEGILDHPNHLGLLIYSHQFNLSLMLKVLKDKSKGESVTLENEIREALKHV